MNKNVRPDMFSTALKSVFFIFLLFVLPVSSEHEPVANISASLAEQLCSRHNKFQETHRIQPPLKTPPKNDEASCGSYLWTKCESALCSSSSPLFVAKICGEIEIAKKTEYPIRKRRKKGKAIAQMTTEMIQQFQNESSSCANSSVKGLRNPVIVSSASRYPSLVTIERGDQTGNSKCQAKLCTGLILNKNWIVVTQAGCFYHYEPDYSDHFVIVAGKRKMYAKEKTEQRRSVAEYIPHPGYKAEEFKYYKDNIGLVRLSAPFEFNEYAQPVDLKAIEAIWPITPISKLKLVGWLLKQPMTMTTETVLQSNLIESRLDYVPTHECYDKKMEEDGAWPNTLICAGGCLLHGDEKNQPLRNVLYAQAKFKSLSKSIPVPIGLGPMRHKFSSPEHGVFVNLVSYIPWINETIQGQGHRKGQGYVEGQGDDEYQNEYQVDDEGQTTQSPEPESEFGIKPGENAPLQKYKSIVNIEVKRSYSCHVYSCTGSILNEQWFLTAASCVSDWEKTKIRVIVGDYDILKRDRGEKVMSISKVIIHENWNSSKYTNNIALVKVRPSFKFNSKVQKVTLPDPSFDTLGPFTAVGWALTDDEMVSPILEQVVIPFVPFDECSRQFADEQPQPDGDGQICAGNSTNGICKTKSGGFPLYHISEFGDQIIIGLGSYGGSICEQNEKAFVDPFSPDAHKSLKEQPVVFTKVTSFIDWIRKNAEMPEPTTTTSTTTVATTIASSSTTALLNEYKNI